MSINYKSDAVVAPPRPPLMMAMMFVNAVFGLVVLGAWTYVSTLVAEPIAWATWRRIYRTGYMFDVFDYPFSMLWLMPLCFIGLAWVADRTGARGLAWTCVTIPILTHALIIGWFYLAPPEWR